ncbi:MAG TPA: phosphoadenylyl-sulfate reductase [Kofleriaceae bacterium]|jgi:phosphoadenylyl-sulfate reductase (thioredoxin)|nr:phosphoadenylyl-sulfate reductase [Kofleriaceae bacterium]
MSELEGKSALDILRYAADRFAPRITCATSLGAEDCVLIDLIGSAKLPIDFFTLDTGVLFPETYALWQKLEARYGITIRAVRPVETIDRLWETEPDRCCDLRKVKPLRAELGRWGAWITGVRRDQTPDRANAQIVEDDRKFGLIKVNPLVAWTHKDVWRHLVDHGVPYNPLHDQGYPSIGCEPCTSPVADGEDPRAGRWRGSVKKECGLHSLPVVK